MKKILYCTAVITYAYLFQSCVAMESKERHPSLQIINGIEEPRCGHFLDERTVILSHKNGCTIHHLPTNTEIKKISGIPFPHIALHPNKKSCALTDEKEVKIYNIKTGVLKWQPHSAAYYYQIADFIASVFEPLDHNITILQKNDCTIIDCYYKRVGWAARANGLAGQLAPTIAFHPTEKIMCHAQNEGPLSFHHTKDFKKIDNHPIIVRQTDTPFWHTFCQFSPDGSSLMEGDQKNFRLRNNEDGSVRPGSMDNIHEIIFHPNGQFLITLSQPNNLLSYWDLINKPAHPTISMSCSSAEDNPPIEHKHMHTYLSCDLLGENLLVILSRQCLIVSMPFEVIYQPQAREECIFAFFALQQYLPKDIRQILIRKLLTLCKRQKKEIIKRIP